MKTRRHGGDDDPAGLAKGLTAMVAVRSCVGEAREGEAGAGDGNGDPGGRVGD
jgi:hypothetical protein